MAHQTTDDLVYVRNTDWAGEVLQCQQVGAQLWRAEIRCRSSFSLEGSFELLSPRKPVRSISLSDLWHIADSRYDIPKPNTPEDWQMPHTDDYPVSEANHPGERYWVTLDAPVGAQDIIRVLR